MVKTRKRSSTSRTSKTKDKSKSKVHGRQRKGKVASQKRRTTTTTTKRSSKGRSKPRTKKRIKTSDIVIKRTGGRREKFETDKMAQTVSRSGTPFLLARDVAKTVSEKVIRQQNDIATAEGGKEERKSSASTIEVDGGEIRKMVAEELKERNRPDIASSYSGERPENARVGGHDIMDKNQQPLHDANAAIQSKLMFDSSTQMARSTKSSSQIKR